MSLIHSLIASLDTCRELPPKRLSSRRGDKGYRSNNKLKQYKVLLDGVEQHDCEIADVDEGYIERISVKTNKFAKIESVIRSGKIYGTVEIKERTWNKKLAS